MAEIDEIYDVIIVGAGPCGLATAARLRERKPDALFTDEEHRRYHWIRKHGHKVALKHVKSGKVKGAQSTGNQEYNMLVLDSAADQWLGQWSRLFKAYDISYLRSPMLWHCDPLNRDALLAHAWENKRENEMIEIEDCVGKEVSKHVKKKKLLIGRRHESKIAINARDQNDYYTPSLALFRDHCMSIADRYKLIPSELIRKETVQDLDWGVIQGVSVDDEKLFTVKTDQSVRYARAVVLAVGPANTPRIPRIPSMLTESGVIPQACHSAQIGVLPHPIVQKRIDAHLPTNILVIGGGLTSAQLSDLAIRKGVTKVWHVMRGPVRVKHFDVDLQWMGKYKNVEQARFWTADSDEERFEIIKEARGGGSLTPTFHKKIKKHVASEKLVLVTNTVISDAKFVEDDDGRGVWRVKFDPPAPGVPPFDYIYFATGIQTDFTTLPYLQTILAKYPIMSCGGMPCINDDLMWTTGMPLFLTGRLAQLQLGPAAPNIGGAKVGAERIAWAIEDLMAERRGGEDFGWSAKVESYASGKGNMYSALVDEDEITSDE